MTIGKKFHNFEDWEKYTTMTVGEKFNNPEGWKKGDNHRDWKMDNNPEDWKRWYQPRWMEKGIVNRRGWKKSYINHSQLKKGRQPWRLKKGSSTAKVGTKLWGMPTKTRLKSAKQVRLRERCAKENWASGLPIRIRIWKEMPMEIGLLGDFDPRGFILC